MLFSDAAAESMVYDKTSVGFKIDFYAQNETYANLDVVLNCVALPVQMNHDVSQQFRTFRFVVAAIYRPTSQVRP